MYTESDRKEFMDNILLNVKKSKNIIGTYLIGSASIGFRDIYSDCDFMMAYKENCDPQEIRDEIMEFFNKDEIGYIMERKWSTTIWGISVYLKNGLSTDISFGPLEKLKVSSEQIAVGVDSEDLLKNHLTASINDRKIYQIDYINDGWEFVYMIRKIKIAIQRKNNIYAYQLLNDARAKLMYFEGIKEKQKMHEFKAYNELDKEFLNKIYTTIPKSTESKEIERCYEILLDMFWSLSDKWDNSLKFLLII